MSEDEAAAATHTLVIIDDLTKAARTLFRATGMTGPAITLARRAAEIGIARVIGNPEFPVPSLGALLRGLGNGIDELLPRDHTGPWIRLILHHLAAYDPPFHAAPEQLVGEFGEDLDLLESWLHRLMEAYAVRG